MAKYAEWKKQYSVGDEAIDAQHKQVLAIISDLHAAIESGREYDELKDLLDRMLTYTMTHFKHEEEKMQACGFPDFANHKALHDKMSQRTADLHKHITLITGRDLLRFVKDWWINHIQSEDQCYAPYLSAMHVRKPSSGVPTQPVGIMDWSGQTPTHQ
jgi:hemerythrin